MLAKIGILFLMLTGEDTAIAQVLVDRNGCPILDPNSYLIVAGDTLFIRGEDETLPVTVPSNGTIVIPVLGQLAAAGQTPVGLGRLIRQRLRGNAPVHVDVLDDRSQRYSVDGEVNHPGYYCFDKPPTVLDAIERSGGFRKLANRKQIRVLRGSAIFRFNYKEFRQGKHPEQNILIRKGDQIIVP